MVKQGGVLSPVLFCVDINDSLINLSQCGAGCFIGNIFAGALAYVVQFTPTPSAKRKLLAVCDFLQQIMAFCSVPVSRTILVDASSKRRDLRRQHGGLSFCWRETNSTR